MHDTVELLQRLYQWSCVDANSIDEEKYLLSKKLSEVRYRDFLVVTPAYCLHS